MSPGSGTPLVAYQGEPGAFSERALLELWRGEATPLPCVTFGDVTRAVLEERARFGILPVMNTIAGPVAASVDAIAASGLHVVATSELRIELCLLALPGATIDSLRVVESHPVALRQCRRFLASHPHLEPREAFDTAGAARDVAAAGDATRAAVASAAAGSAYGLAVLVRGIEDEAGNVTSFVVLSRDPVHLLSSALDRARPATNLSE